MTLLLCYFCVLIVAILPHRVRPLRRKQRHLTRIAQTDGFRNPLQGRCHLREVQGRAHANISTQARQRRVEGRGRHGRAGARPEHRRDDSGEVAREGG